MLVGVAFQALRYAVIKFLRATDRMARAPEKPVDEFEAWLDKYSMRPLIDLEPNKEVRQNYGSIRNLVVEVLENDEDDRLRAIGLAYFMRRAPPFTLRQHEREWLEKHYGVKVGEQI